MPGAAPPGAAPSFIFLTKKMMDKRRAGGVWRAAVCPLCGWGSTWHGGRGSHRAPAAPFTGRARVPPPRSHGGTGVAWHSLRGWVGGQSHAGLRGSWPWCPCLRQEHFPSTPLPPWAQPLPPRSRPGTRGWWQSGVGWQALPSPASSPLRALFQPNALYEIVLLWEFNYRGVAQRVSPSAAHTASGATARAGVRLRQLGVPVTLGMCLWW